MTTTSTLPPDIAEAIEEFQGAAMADCYGNDAAILPRARAALEAAILAHLGGGWREIGSAPRDGSFLIANRLGEVCHAQSRDGQRIVSNMPGYADWTWGEPATHWKPFDKAPSPDLARAALAENDD